MIRVLLACGDPALLGQLRAALAEQEDFTVCGTAKCFLQTIRRAKSVKLDLIILDRVAVPRHAISAIQILKRTCPHVSLFLVAAKAGMATEKEALAHGIDAVFSQKQEFASLIENARAICGQV